VEFHGNLLQMEDQGSPHSPAHREVRIAEGRVLKYPALATRELSPKALWVRNRFFNYSSQKLFVESPTQFAFEDDLIYV